MLKTYWKYFRVILPLGLLLVGLLWFFGSQATTNAAITRKVNIPYFNTDPVGNHFDQTAIFWYGQVTPSTNYTDVRLGYNNTELYAYMAVIDKRLWNGGDSLSFYLSADTPSGGTFNNTWRFDANLSVNQTEIKQAYKRSGASWVTSPIAFTTLSGWRGNGYNDNNDDKGWTMTYHIPFSSLGLAQPANGTVWRIAVATHNQNDAAHSPLPDTFWPETFNSANFDTSTWGQLVYGLPNVPTVTVVNQQSLTVRQNLNGASVSDAGVGGYSNCGGSLDYWTQWGVANYANYGDMNIQNQSDISDYVCFSKYYATFPFSLPPGKGIVSAKLTLHLFGGSTTPHYPSYIQVFRVAENWNETTINWNNAPLALENFGSTVVNPVNAFPGWPGIPYQWDVTAIARQSYQEGTPLRLAMYDSDSNYHSGKYFVTSNTGDWNAVARPTLDIVYGDVAPSAPTNLAANLASSNQINLNWSDSSPNETGFKLERSIGNGNSFVALATVGANVTTYQNLTLTELTSYYYRVYAYNGAGNSGYSNVVSATTGINAPTQLTATATSESNVKLSWYDNSGVESGFKVERQNVTDGIPFTEILAGAGANGGTGPVIFNDNTAVVGKNYNYRIRAFQGGNFSAYSNVIGSITSLNTPTNLLATVVSANQINLSWQDNSNLEDGFKLERQDATAGTSWTELLPGAGANSGTGTVNYQDKTTVAGKIYYYQVRAFQGSNFSAYSNLGSSTTPAGGSCNVTSGSDSRANTLRAAVIASCSMISLNVSPIIITSSPLTLSANQSIGGGCNLSGPTVTIQGAAGIAGLILKNNFVYGLKIVRFIGPQLKVPVGNGGNKLYCVKVSLT